MSVGWNIDEGCKTEILKRIRQSLSRHIEWSLIVLFFQNCVSVIRPRRVRRAGRVARMEEFIWVDNSCEKLEKALRRVKK